MYRDLHHAMYIMLNCFLSTFYCLILHRVSMVFFSKFLNKINVFITCVKKNILVSTYIIHSFLPVKQLHVNTTMKMFTEL